MILIDTHCHLNDKEAFSDPVQIIREAIQAGVQKLIVVGVDTSTSEYAVKLSEQHQEVYATVGWHPNEATHFNQDELSRIEDLLKHPKVVAVGEVGLDFYRDYASSDQQYACLIPQLDLAQKNDLPVVLHSRNAYPEFLHLLESRSSQKLLFHCFTGNLQDAKRAIDLGCYFGIDGPITYKKADELRAMVKTLPRDRVLLETDSPWLAPHPYRGKMNHPAWLSYINESLAELFRISETECAELTTQNAERFFNLRN